MRALKKTIVLLLLTATAVAGGCGGGHYHAFSTASNRVIQKEFIPDPNKNLLSGFADLTNML